MTVHLLQTRIGRVPAGEKNYHIFYQILAGLSGEEKRALHVAYTYVLVLATRTYPEISNFMQDLQNLPIFNFVQ